MPNKIPHAIPDFMLNLSRYQLFLIIDFLLTQNTVLRRKFKGRVPLSDYDRSTLAAAGMPVSVNFWLTSSPSSNQKPSSNGTTT